MKKMIKTQVL